MIDTADTNKRYYWLKLPEDFFRQKEIKQLRKIAGGDTFTIVYLKMLLRSLKNNGRLYYEGIDEDFVSELALDIDEDMDNVKITVAFLMAKGLLVESQEDEYTLSAAESLTGSESYSAERVRRFREKQQLALQSNADVTARNEEIDIEKEIEIEKRDRDKKQVQRKRFTPPTIDEIREYAKEIGFTSLDVEYFYTYYQTAGWKKSNGKPILNWKLTVQTWKKNESEKHTQTVKTNPTLQYEQRDYSQDDYSRMFIDLNGGEE